MVLQNPQSPAATVHGICLQDLSLLLLSFIYPLFPSWTSLLTSSIPAGSTIQHIPVSQGMALGMCNMGSPMWEQLGTPFCVCPAW